MKVVLVLSPQSWGKMYLAKHHYAIELAKNGNKVYFLNPPDNKLWSLKKNRIKIARSIEYPNLFIIDQQLFFPYNLKFHSRWLYNVLIRKQIAEILRLIPMPDLIWSFDLGNLFPLNLFNDKIIKVFHPVDEPANRHAMLAGSGADVMFSVTSEILEKYKALKIPSYFINHGLADEFILGGDQSTPGSGVTQVGLSGNFLRPDLDRAILLQIIEENQSLLFHFYGSYKVNQSNIGASEDLETWDFIGKLESCGNVRLHGVLNTMELAHALNQMDVFLICYDIQRDQSRGTNYHKVMEYLSTGKVIVSNNITTYIKYPEWIRMIVSRKDNADLPALFRETIGDLANWNSDKLQNERKNFARENTYQNQLRKIDQCINSLDTVKKIL